MYRSVCVCKMCDAGWMKWIYPFLFKFPQAFGLWKFMGFCGNGGGMERGRQLIIVWVL